MLTVVIPKIFVSTISQNMKGRGAFTEPAKQWGAGRPCPQTHTHFFGKYSFFLPGVSHGQTLGLFCRSCSINFSLKGDALKIKREEESLKKILTRGFFLGKRGG